MQKLLLILALFVMPFTVLAEEIVSIYCTWDDLEAARQQRIFGSGLNNMLRNAGFSVATDEYPNQSQADSLIKSDTKLVIGSSHGDPDTFFDCQNWTPIWTSGAGKHLGPMNGKIVHLLACQNGKRLAPTMVSEGGARAVLAYVENFNFSSKSKYNNYCAAGDAEFDRALAQEGATTGIAYQKAKNKLIEFANQANNEGEAEEYETLMHNANCIKLFGSTSARLRGRDGDIRMLSNIVAEAKFDKPSPAILKRILVARDARGFVSLHDYREQARKTGGSFKAMKVADWNHYLNMSEEQFTRLCIQHLENYSDSYELGIRGTGKTYILNKTQMILEVQNNTEIGRFLVRRYFNFLNCVEELLGE